MNYIKERVEECGIPEKRDRLQKNRKLIRRINSEMSNLTMNINVAQYVNNLNRINYLRVLNREEDLEEITKLQQQATSLEFIEEVSTYKTLREEIKLLEEQNREYYKSIQIDLRESLLEEHLPDIYIYQGLFDKENNLSLYRHIIVPYTVLTDFSNPGITITRNKEIDSIRSARHFYNSVSYRYLEQLSKDYSFDLEGKDLGKVKILPRGR